VRRTLIFVVLLASAAAILGVIRLRAQPRRVLVAARAQVGRISPHESVTETVNGAQVTIVYGRPSMRGRVVFGSLVPWGIVWCPGADEATTLESTKELRIGTLRIPMGPHTIWMLPAPDRWTLIVSREPDGFHTRYNSSADLGRVAMARRHLSEPVEQLTFGIAAAPSGGGTITFSWEKTEVSVPFAVQ
jgi:hypothetical protein